jgi:hypothetical protein
MRAQVGTQEQRNMAYSVIVREGRALRAGGESYGELIDECIAEVYAEGDSLECVLAYRRAARRMLRGRGFGQWVVGGSRAWKTHKREMTGYDSGLGAIARSRHPELRCTPGLTVGGRHVRYRLGMADLRALLPKSLAA